MTAPPGCPAARAALLTALAVVVTACGGGGGGAAAPPPPVQNPPPPPPPEGIEFVDITPESGIARTFGVLNPTPGSMSESFGGGVGAGDYDNDGDVDLYLVAGDTTPNQLFENLGNNQFVEVAAAAGLGITHKSSGPTFADIDGDGDLDVFLGGVEGAGVRIFRNDDGLFVDATAQSGVSISAVNSVSAAFGDYDLDGDLDMFVSHWGNEQQSDTQHLWKNNGDGSFESASIESGIADSILVQFAMGGIPGGEFVDYTFTPNFADIDDDGYPDLLVTGDFATSQIFINDRDGTFSLVTDTDVVKDENGMGAAVADYDNDGDLDWFVTAIFQVNDATGALVSIGNRLYRNDGAGQFSDVTISAAVDRGGWGWGGCFADFDNDGHLDIFHVNGWEQEGTGENDFRVDPARLFMSNGDGTFVERAGELGLRDSGQGRGIVCFDSDRDGDIDVFIANNDDNSLVAFRNEGGNRSNYLTIRLNGLPPNTQGIGARVYVTSDGQTQMRELQAGSNYASQNPAEAHFGLADGSQADEVVVNWPDGATSRLELVGINRLLEIDHPDR